MPIQEIPLELDHLLQKGGLVYWQASNNRRSVAVLSPWAQDILGEKAENLVEQQGWYEFLHPEDAEKTRKVVDSIEGTDTYQVDYRWSIDGENFTWVREIGRRKATSSQDFEGLLFSINEEKELESKALNISEWEKRKLGRELHDDLCQQLAGMLFFTNNLVYQIKTGRDTETLVEATNEIKKQLQLSIEKIRCLSHGLNPVSLKKKTFQECIIELIQQSQTLYSVSCQFNLSSDINFEDQEKASHLFRIAQESINNAIRHGNADTISITLQREANFGILTIRDNGSGFKQDPRETEGMGLDNLRIRARMINAAIQISNHEQGGAMVRCKFAL
ncbi:MAG: PAS domain-containing protein [Verrucomicrobiae bacterium]|nr:PAS domain-containing protein [Verrucomicrobiae bacterium]